MDLVAEVIMGLQGKNKARASVNIVFPISRVGGSNGSNSILLKHVDGKVVTCGHFRGGKCWCNQSMRAVVLWQWKGKMIGKWVNGREAAVNMARIITVESKMKKAMLSGLSEVSSLMLLTGLPPRLREQMEAKIQSILKGGNDGHNFGVDNAMINAKMIEQHGAEVHDMDRWVEGAKLVEKEVKRPWPCQGNQGMDMLGVTRVWIVDSRGTMANDDSGVLGVGFGMNGGNGEN